MNKIPSATAHHHFGLIVLLNLLSPDEDSQSNGAEASDKAAIDLVTRRNNIDTQSFEPEQWHDIYKLPPSKQLDQHTCRLKEDNTEIEEESPYF